MVLILPSTQEKSTSIIDLAGNYGAALLSANTQPSFVLVLDVV